MHKVEDKTCDLCGSEMKPVGKEFVHDELVYVPAKLFVRKHYVEVVKCVNCGTDESRDAEQPDDIEKEHFRKATAPSLLIPRSFCSPELLAHIIYEKYCNAMPPGAGFQGTRSGAFQNNHGKLDHPYRGGEGKAGVRCDESRASCR